MSLSHLREDLEIQLQEMEVIESMYPGKDELTLHDPWAISELKNWLKTTDGPSSDPNLPPISFTLHMKIESNKLDVTLQLPKNYPSGEKPDLYLRGDTLMREKQTQLTCDLKEMLSSMDPGEMALGQVISWLQENSLAYFTPENKAKKKEALIPEITKQVDIPFVRLWIYSHHIYSKTKRKNILDLGKEFSLTGFCMPGKPGIMCLEGTDRNTLESWGVIKSWNWKKINVKYQEEAVARDFEDFQAMRKFATFEEVGFVKNSESRDYHMDMGEFFQYLKKHKCDYMFKEFFGIDKS